jgi:hypothetical protein
MRFVKPLFLATTLACLALGVVHADRAPALFSTGETLSLRLRAPLDDLFAHAAHDADYTVQGSIAYDGAGGREVRIRGVEISVRGNTSKQDVECSFPKLKLRFRGDAAREDSIFRGAEVVKIGTHCGEAPDEQLTRKFGRLANEKSPIREAFVYHLLEVMGVPALKARPARITYEDASGHQPPLVRNAMLLEDTTEARKRLDAGDEITMEHFGSADADLTVADTVNVTFAEAMIGNFDWCLRFTSGDTYRCDRSKPLWNILAFERDDDRRAVPLVHDFDLSGMVTGSHLWFGRVLNENYSASKSRPEVEVVSQLQRTRSLFARGELDAARQRFLRRRDEAFAALHRSTVDANGRTIIERYLTAFFAAIASDDAFYGPVIVESTVAYADADGTAPACARAATAPVGTPVGPPIDRRGDRVQVQLLDALWHWTGPRRCSAIVRGPVWIDAQAIGSDYPR